MTTTLRIKGFKYKYIQLFFWDKFGKHNGRTAKQKWVTFTFPQEQETSGSQPQLESWSEREHVNNTVMFFHVYISSDNRTHKHKIEDIAYYNVECTEKRAIPIPFEHWRSMTIEGPKGPWVHVKWSFVFDPCKECEKGLSASFFWKRFYFFKQ